MNPRGDRRTLTTTFRQIEKENPGGQIPVALSRKLRRLAGEHRRSLSSVLTEAVAKGLGEDPREFGLTDATASAPSLS
jgi:hypothetical protein